MEIIELLFIPLAVGLTLLLLNLLVSRARQSEAKQALRNSILNEIKNNEDLLNKGFDTNNYGIKTFRHNLFRNAFDNALSNDNYTSLSPTIQDTLASYYDGIDSMNELVNIRKGEQETKILKRISSEQTNLETKLRKDTEALKKYLANLN